MPVKDSPLRNQFGRLYEEAKKRLPHTIETPEEAEAWIAQEVLGLAQRDHNRTHSLQALLVNYINNGHIWMHHPENYETLRDFLKGVGNDMEGNKLSPTAISQFCTIAEIIYPFCEAKGITIDPLLTGRDWGKFVASIGRLREYIEDEDDPKPLVEAALKDVKALPNRDAVRQKYQKPRKDKEIRGDALRVGDYFLVGLQVKARDWPQFKAKLGHDVEWEVLLDRMENGAILRLETDEQR